MWAVDCDDGAVADRTGRRSDVGWRLLVSRVPGSGGQWREMGCELALRKQMESSGEAVVAVESIVDRGGMGSDSEGRRFVLIGPCDLH